LDGVQEISGRPIQAFCRTAASSAESPDSETRTDSFAEDFAHGREDRPGTSLAEQETALEVVWLRAEFEQRFGGETH
jgi:hypothetical protein